MPAARPAADLSGSRAHPRGFPSLDKAAQGSEASPAASKYPRRSARIPRASNRGGPLPSFGTGRDIQRCAHGGPKRYGCPPFAVSTKQTLMTMAGPYLRLGFSPPSAKLHATEASDPLGGARWTGFAMSRTWHRSIFSTTYRYFSEPAVCPSVALNASRTMRTAQLILPRLRPALLHGPEQIADLPVPVAESPGAVRIGHPERSHLVEYLAPNSVFNSLPRQRSSPHLRPDDRLVTIDRVLHHASLGVA